MKFIDGPDKLSILAVQPSLFEKWEKQQQGDMNKGKWKHPKNENTGENSLAQRKILLNSAKKYDLKIQRATPFGNGRGRTRWMKEKCQDSGGGPWNKKDSKKLAVFWSSRCCVSQSAVPTLSALSLTPHGLNGRMGMETLGGFPCPRLGVRVGLARWSARIYGRPGSGQRGQH